MAQSLILPVLALGLFVVTPIQASDPIVTVVNRDTGLSATQQIVHVTATSRDCVVTMPLDGTMVGKTIQIVLVSGSTHQAIVSWQSGDTGNGSSSPYRLSVSGSLVTFMGTPSISPLGTGDWKLVPDPYYIPPPVAPNILSATAKVNYTPFGGATYYSFSGSLKLPTGDPNFPNLQRIIVTWSPPGGVENAVAILPSPFASDAFAGPIPALLQGTTSVPGTLIFRCYNKYGDFTASPFTIQITVAASNAALVPATKNLQFTSQLGLSPAAQILSVTSTDAPLGFTVASDANWLSVSPSTGTTPLVLSVSADCSALAIGTYVGTITVRRNDGVSASTATSVNLTITPPVPSVGAGGVVSAASNASGQPVAPGSLVSIYGARLADSMLQASNVPLPTKLGNTFITFNGNAAPLHFVSSGQINAQVPWEVFGSSAQMVVTSNGTSSSPVYVSLAAVAPGIFATGTQAIAYGNADYLLAAAPSSIPGLTTHPAKIGDLATLVILATGLGPVSPAVQTGNIPLNDGVLHPTISTPVVRVGGVAAQVIFSGMSSYVGVYQINIVIQPGTPTGNAVPVTITMNEITSNAPTIAVTSD